MPVLWQIRCTPPSGPAVTKTPKAWGVRTDATFEITFATQVVDTLALTVDQAFDDDAVFPYGSAVDLFRDGVRVFAGRVVSAPRRGSVKTESVTYNLVGPWWWLDNAVFEQDWKVASGFDLEGALVLVNRPLSRVIIGTDIFGGKVSAKRVIEEVFAFLTDRLGAPVALGDCEVDQIIPSVEMRDITCAEVLAGVLRWFPQVQAVWDVSTGTPTLNLLKRASLPVRNLATNTDDIVDIALTPRRDLQPAAVLVRYTRTNTATGGSGGSESVNEIIEDLWPTDADAFAAQTLHLVVQMTGSTQTSVSQTVVTAAIAENSKAWWAKKVPWLKDADVSSYDIVSGSTSVTPEVEGATVYEFELLEGALAPWMNRSETPVVVSAEIKYKRGETEGKETFKVRLRSTNSGSGTFSTVTNFQEAEVIPPGLARRYFEELDPLQYDGTVALDSDEWDGLNLLGYAVNLAGFAKRPEWATMRALVVGQSVDLKSGATTLTLGPAKHLNPDDWVTLARPARGRDNAVAAIAQSRATGKTVAAATPLPDKGAKSEVTSVGTPARPWAIAATDGAGGYSVGKGRVNGTEAAVLTGSAGAKVWIYADATFAGRSGEPVSSVTPYATTTQTDLLLGSEQTRRILIGSFTPGTPPVIEQYLDAHVWIPREAAIPSLFARTRGANVGGEEAREVVVEAGEINSIRRRDYDGPYGVNGSVEEHVYGMADFPADGSWTTIGIEVAVAYSYSDSTTALGTYYISGTTITGEHKIFPKTNDYWKKAFVGNTELLELGEFKVSVKDALPPGCCEVTTTEPDPWDPEPGESTPPMFVAPAREVSSQVVPWPLADVRRGTDGSLEIVRRHTGDIFIDTLPMPEVFLQDAVYPETEE